MNKKLIRKEVWIWEERLIPLQQVADNKGWSLKKLMEFILAKESIRLEAKSNKTSKK